MKEEDDSLRSQQIEWFHSFAKQSAIAIAEQATEANRERVDIFVAYCLPGHSFPLGLGPEQFAEAVRELRENEVGWNRSLMRVLIQADDLVSSKGAAAAVASLESFAESCPWALFAQVARDQASQYGATQGNRS